MSLFKAKDWWSTEINENSKELISFTNLTLGRLGEEGSGDVVIYGGCDGILQLFKPQQSFQPTDLLLEYPTREPVIQIKTGKFVFGSQTENIGVLHPKKLSVYSFVTKEGQAEYGDQNNLSLEYTHALPSHSLYMVCGNFGGIIGKDFICVLCLDGQLLFYEQEVATFSCLIPNICLPSSFEYCNTSDAFVFCTNDMVLESYSYHNLSQQGINGGNKKNTPDWTYNIGDNIKCMEKVQTSNSYCSLFALSDRILYCLLDNGTLKFMKRFDYEPICFHAYLIGWYHENNSHLMEMVVSETSTLFIYEETTLLWACQLTCLPVAVKRGFFPGLSGAIVTLAEDGKLKCCYLGTEPELFTAPALAAVEINFEKAQEELDQLQHEIDSFNDAVEMTVSDKTAEKEIMYTIDMELVQTSEENNENFSNTETNGFPTVCKITIILKPSDKTNIEIIDVVLSVKSPLICTNSSESFKIITDEIVMTSEIYWDKDSNLHLTSSSLEIIISFTNKQGYSRVLRRREKLPFSMIFKAASPAKDAKYKVTISTNANMVDITQLFRDINLNQSNIASSALGLNSHSDGDNLVSIISGKSSQRYRIQSNSLALIGLVISEFCERLDKFLQMKMQYNKEESKKSIISFSMPLSHEILDQIMISIEKHLNLRIKVAEAEEVLDILSSQFIMIQKRLIIKYRERPPTSCENLFFILSDTYEKIQEIVSDLQRYQNEIIICGNELKCCIVMLQAVFKIMDKDINEINMILDCLNPDQLDSEEQAWEEMALSSAIHLLSTQFSKDDKFFTFDPLTPIKEYNVKKCVKYIRLLIELSINKISKADNGSPKKTPIEDMFNIETKPEVPETDNNILSLPEGSTYGIKIGSEKKDKNSIEESTESEIVKQSDKEIEDVITEEDLLPAKEEKVIFV